MGVNMNIKMLTILIILIYGTGSAQTDNETFNLFFSEFISVSKSNNVAQVAPFMNFPFISDWGAGADKISKTDFLFNSKYQSLIPYADILEKCEFNKKKTKTINGSKYVLDFKAVNGDFIISYIDISEEEGDTGEYHFSIFDGEFKYYKLVSSALNGPPYENK
jgi:hypothetical protein